MPPLAIAAVASGSAAAAGIAGSIIQADAAKDAASAQLQGQRDAIAAQKEYSQKALDFYRDQAGIARQDLAPLRDAQTDSLGKLRGLTEIGNPMEEVQRKAATQQIQMQLAAQGLLRSKGQSDQLQNLELGLANQRVNILQGLSGLGGLQQSAGIAQDLGAMGANSLSSLGQAIGSSFQNMGAINAQNRMAQGQALAGGINSIGNAFQGFLGNWSALQAQDSNKAFLQDLLNGNKRGPGYAWDPRSGSMGAGPWSTGV